MKSKTKTILRRFFIAITLLFLLILACLLALIFFGVTLDLGGLKGGVEASAKAALGREVKIEGPVTFEFSDWPAIEIQDVHIANTPGASQPLFLNAGFARLQVGLFPLLKGDIQIGEIKAENVTLNLENGAQGQPNWTFTEQKEIVTEPVPEDNTPEIAATDETSKGYVSFAGLEDLSLKKIAVNYHDASLNKTISFNLDELSGEAVSGKPIVFQVKGALQDDRYDLEFQGAPIEKLLSGGKELWHFQISGEVAGKNIGAKGDVVRVDGEPEVNLAFGVEDVDVGEILSRLDLVKGLQATTGNMGVKVFLKGSSLKTLVEQSSLQFGVKDGRWEVKSPTSDNSLDITDVNGSIVVEQGDVLTMNLTGMVDRFPVKFVITGSPLADYVTELDTVPLTIDAEIADSFLRFSGEVALPVTNKDLNLALSFKTERLNNLNEILQLDLPPLGPVSFSTRYKQLGKKFTLPQIDIQVGESKLNGKMSLDNSQKIPKVDIEVVSDLFRIDDFDALLPTPSEQQQTTGKTDGKEKETAQGKSGDSPEEPAENKHRELLSPEVLRSLNAKILIEAKKVTSGADNLGAGLLNVSLKDGLLAIKPLRLDIPGGGMEVEFDYLPSEKDITVNLKANIDEFDLGVIARRRKPETDMGGKFRLDTALHAVSPDFKGVMTNARGHFDFGLVPHNFSAGILDLWAVNLLSSIMTEVSEEEKSEINCVVVRLGIEDGLMAEKAIYMDTSNMHVSGTADIDFIKREIDILLSPKAKTPEFFSLAVPIKVQGKFEDFGIGIGLTRIAGTVVSFITSPVHVPIRKIFTNDIPADGREACRQAWTLSDE